MMLERQWRSGRASFAAPPLALFWIVLGLQLAGCSNLLGDVQLEARSSSFELTPTPAPPSMPAPSSMPMPAPPRTPPQSANERCSPGGQECFDAARQVCSDIGTWSPVEICASAALCSPERCFQPTCRAGDMRCDDKELQTCNDGRDGWSLVDTCIGPAYCDPNAGACSATPCEPGARRCNGARYESCRDDQSDWDLLSACESQDLCEIALAQNADSCAPPVCDPGQVRCDGVSLERCNAGRSGWDLVDRCQTEALCGVSASASRVRCEPAHCASGAFICEGNELRTCNAGLTDFEDSAACLSSELCDPEQGLCGAPECQPNEQRCNGAQIEVCDAARTGFVATSDAPCASAELCHTDSTGAASCTAPVCDAGQFRCAGNLLQRCSDGRDAWADFATCESADLCDASQGALGCQTPVCALGEQRCTGAVVEECNAARSGFVKSAQCASAALCVQNGTAAACSAPACAAGATRCQNRSTLLTCNADQTGFDASACDGVLGRCVDGPPAACDALGNRR